MVTPVSDAQPEDNTKVEEKQAPEPSKDEVQPVESKEEETPAPTVADPKTDETPAEETAKRMVGCVNVKYVVRSRCRTGGAYNLASIHGVPSVLIERGQLSLFSREEIEADKADVRSILRCLGVLEGDWMNYPKQELFEYNDDAPCTGCWYPEKKPGDWFRKGEKLGKIRDYFGRSLFTEIAPEDGVLLYQCASLNIIEKGPMVSYGVPRHDS